ncbi:MAG: hypothetical protein EZS28_013681 [Streblomastix strix]|uniref:Uncharacterized protein n=1 Tax=Streblomastix strix TaxID=222440 RepID=A0A5J4W7D5_9EUKA|nr:MAG: hypothetical protein EZS28_013681 [Streblomastix strix]
MKEVLVIDIQGSGKTRLIEVLTDFAKSGEKDLSEVEIINQSLNTNGVELTNITVGKEKILLREIGGSLKPLWIDFFERSQFIMFVVDVSDYAQIPSAVCEIIELISNPDSKNINILIVLNKIDIDHSILIEEIQMQLRLDSLEDNNRLRINFVEVSALLGINIGIIYKWLEFAQS